MKRVTIAAMGCLFLVAGSAVNAQMNRTAVNGVVVKVDPSASKITLRHGEIANLHMDAMTMVFAVRDPNMLSGLKAGDAIKFEAEEVNGVKTVTEIKPAK